MGVGHHHESDDVFDQCLRPNLARALGILRPYTIHYYYQPQGMILTDQWYSHGEIWTRLAILAAFGLGGYLIAWLAFSRRDMPAPL